MDKLHVLLGLENEQAIIPWIKRIYFQITKGSCRIIDSDDLMAEGLVTLVEARANLCIDQQTSFRSYAFLRVRGRMIDLLRREGRLLTKLDLNSRELIDRFSLAGFNPEDALMRKQIRKKLLASIIKAKLSDREQTALKDRFIRDLTFENISKKEKQSTRAYACKIVARALKKIKRQSSLLELKPYLAAA